MGAIADADVASVAALMGDRARCAMLQVLIDGSERPAGELAKAAGISPATASGHLQRLIAGGLVAVRSSGRHRYYGLSGPLVAAAIEALSLISLPVEARSLRARRASDRGLTITDLGHANLPALSDRATSIAVA